MIALVGCAANQAPMMPAERVELRERAEAILKAAVDYPHNPAVRVQAVQALELVEKKIALPWLRTALADDHPAVRFAACVAIGRLRDSVSLRKVSERVEDADPNVQVGALYALHRLGDHSGTSRLPSYLLEHPEITVRRNAALVIGLLEEPSAIKVLARAMRDRDAGVRQHALEAMARLGNDEARRELTLMTSAGIGSEEVFALQALAATNDRVFFETFQYKFETAAHIETRLAAARGLGRLGSDRGLEVALAALRTKRPVRDEPNDPAEDQLVRVRQLAASALGAIGRREALPALAAVMEETPDPRIQVSAARAILEILAAESQGGWPLGDGVESS